LTSPQGLPDKDARPASTTELFRLLIEEATDYALFILDTEGRVATWNKGAQRLNGYAPSEIIGKHFSVFYPREAVETGWPDQELEAAKKEGRFEDEGWRVRKDGTLWWANVIITALRDARGRLQGFSKITRDLTARRETEDRLRQSEEKFRLLLEGVEDYAIFMLDAEGRVTSWNAGAERILGYRDAEIVGHSFERFFAPADVAAGRPAEELRSAMLHRRSEDRGWRLRKDGSRFWAEVVVTALRDSEGRMRGFAKVVRDLSERKRMESLEEQGRNLTEFLAMLAHELRNPLAPIRNALAIIAASEDGSSRIKWSREVIERQTGHLTRLVDDLLDVSRITRGKLRLQAVTLDLHLAVQRAIESSRPLIDRRRHRLHVSVPSEPLLVHGDLTRLTQVFLNLLNNAAKYTPEGGDVWIEMSCDPTDAVVKVRDNGAGIPRQMLDAVFDLFAQGERTLDRSEGGLGIGLTLARRIVALHGGSISAKSEGPGTGAEFTVSLPRLDPESAQARPVVGSAEGRAGQGAARHFLVVDDNEDAANSMAMLLRMMGHEVDIELTGPAAVERSRERLPDVVLLDIGLPGMDGYAVAAELRKLPGGEALKVIALTGYGQEEDRRRSLEAGFDGHLVKPVAPGDLFLLLEGAKGEGRR